MNFVISFMKTITLSFDVSAKITGNNRKKSMDTDELSEMAYQTLVLASQASDYLKAEIGALSRKFENEDDYLNGVLRFVRIIKADPGGYLDAWNLLEKSDISFFKKAVSKLEEHISQVMATPIEMRGSPPDF